MKPLTARQAEVLTAIIAHLVREQRPPTFRELGAAVGIASTNGVSACIELIERKGYLACSLARARGLRVLRWPDGAEFGMRAVRL